MVQPAIARPTAVIPMTGGVELAPNDLTEIELGTELFTGYTIVNTETMEAAVQLTRLRLGPPRSVGELVV